MIMEHEYRQLNSRETLLFLLLIATGAAFFFYRFGFLVLDPTSTEWLLGANDSATYYLGWQYFRQEPWFFPLGRIDSYLAPLGTSIPLVDALPLLAIPLKLITNLLPSDFQYFGIWILVNYSMQVLFGYLVLRNLCSSRILCLAGALFFLFCPSFLFRHGHISQSSHWLLLAALYFYSKPLASWEICAKIFAWFILIGFVSLIHTYLTMMVLGIGLADLTREYLVTRRLVKRRYFLTMAGLCGIVLFSWYSTGYLIYSIII